jgi:hypothetical protein
MPPTVAGYLIYLLLMTAVTVGVGALLYHHGEPFLIDVFAGDRKLAQTINRLLLAGFYLTNFALVLLMLRSANRLVTPLDAGHFVAGRMGLVLIILGGMHFFNVAVLIGVRRRVAQQRLRSSSSGPPGLGGAP